MEKVIARRVLSFGMGALVIFGLLALLSFISGIAMPQSSIRGPNSAAGASNGDG